MPAQRHKVRVKDELKTPNARGSGGRSSGTPSPSKELITSLRCRLTAVEADVERIGKLVNQTAQSQPRHHNDDRSKSHMRTVYLYNMEYGATAAELEAHFAVFGPIHRITMLYCSDGRPRGQAFVDFVKPASAAAALAHNGVRFRGRALFVAPKYTGGVHATQYYSNNHYSYKAAATAWPGPIGSGASDTKPAGLATTPQLAHFSHSGGNSRTTTDAPGPSRSREIHQQPHRRSHHRHRQHSGVAGGRYKPY